MFVPWKESYDKPRQCIKKQYFVDKGPYSQSYGCSNSHVGILQLSTEELMFLNYGAGEDPSEFLDSMEMKPVNPKGNQP